MKYYEYDINYDSKNGSMGWVAIDVDGDEPLTDSEVLEHLQDMGEVEPFEPRDFDCDEITKEEYEANND